MNAIQKKIIFIIAVLVVFSGFLIDKSRSGSRQSREAQVGNGLFVKMNQPLTVHNKTGAKVSAAFYSKRLRRNGSVVRIEDEKKDFKRRPQASLIAVSRNPRDLGVSIKKSGLPRRINVTRARCIDIKSQGHDLVITPTAPKHQH